MSTQHKSQILHHKHLTTGFRCISNLSRVIHSLVLFYWFHELLIPGYQYDVGFPRAVTLETLAAWTTSSPSKTTKMKTKMKTKTKTKMKTKTKPKRQNDIEIKIKTKTKTKMKVKMKTKQKRK
jgi:hypothetical protein